ncbi:MAG: hypothetical protein ACLQKK_20845 [Rhodomicrobium sp.]
MSIVPPLYQYLCQGPDDARQELAIDDMLRVMTRGEAPRSN